MEEKNNEIKKEMTIEDLAESMAKGFEKIEKQADKKTDDLATMIQNNFLSVEERLDSVEERVVSIGKEVKEVKEDTENIKADLNKKVDKFTHNDLKSLLGFIPRGLPR